MFFVFGNGAIIFVLMLLQICIKDQPGDVEDHLARQRKVELRMVSRAATLEHTNQVRENQTEIAAIKAELEALRGGKDRKKHDLKDRRKGIQLNTGLVGKTLAGSVGRERYTPGDQEPYTPT